jgi:hypothetical protein
MSVLVVFAIGAFVAALASYLLRHVRSTPLGFPIGGLCLVLVQTTVNAFFAVLLALRVTVDTDANVSRGALLPVVATMAVVGLVDDLSGRDSLGPLRTIRRWDRVAVVQVVMLLGASMIVPLFRPNVSLPQLMLDASLITLAALLLASIAAGTISLLVTLGCFALLVGVHRASSDLAGTAGQAGAALALLSPVRQGLRLGRSGALVLGAALGVGVVLSSEEAVRAGVLAALIIVHLVDLERFGRDPDGAPR